MSTADEISLDGNAIVYCQGAFNTTYGKTAHGLVRFTRRYKILGVIDDTYAGRDAGEVIDACPSGIPIYRSLQEALAGNSGRVTHMVMGVAPDGGRLDSKARKAVIQALGKGLNVDSGLHEFLSEDPELMALAQTNGVVIRDVRKPPPRDQLHFFSGCIEHVNALKVAVLGTDSAVGKRTTAWLLVQGLQKKGISTELIGTGQTAWLQGARFGVLMDALVNDFVTGEIENAVWNAWQQAKPQVIVLEGQGSLMNPAYPGGFELLAAGRPDIVVLQHAPARKEYDGFPGYPVQPLALQISAIEMISNRPVVAVTINHEGLSNEKVPLICEAITSVTGLPAVDVLLEGSGMLIEVVISHLNRICRKTTHEQEHSKRHA
jgi:uncharacterized NAD-dependent epimerase/dehydratase family protein